ncbi:MAG: DNA-binding protein [Methylococcales bacterium]
MTTKTTQEIKNDFRRKGMTFSSWAKEHDFNRSSVYAVLNGQVKCYYGESFKIAKQLGIKTC